MASDRHARGLRPALNQESLPGALAERADFETQNRRVVAEGNEPASGRPVLMGITKASLATEAWLSVASLRRQVGDLVLTWALATT